MKVSYTTLVCLFSAGVAFFYDPSLLIGIIPCLSVSLALTKHKWKHRMHEAELIKKIKELEERIENCGPWY